MRKVLGLVFILIFSLSAETLISDDFESGTGNWTLTGNWGLEAGTGVSGSYSLTESPGGNYTANNTTTATWITPMDLSESEFATFVFWRKYDFEDEFDYMYFEISYDNGSSWQRKKSWTSQSGDDWAQETIFPISAFSGEVIFRFLFQSDQYVEHDGMKIDDIVFYDVPESHETLMYHQGPVFYEASSHDYNSSFECYDNDGIDSIWVEYLLDGYLFDHVIPYNTSGNFYSFTIPAQDLGTTVDYRICVMEGSEEHIVGRSEYYTYISGTYKKYDSGIASYFKDIQDGQAMAVNITPPSKTSTYCRLCYALIRNYDDNSDSLGDMKFHIWSDEGGEPGYDLITPFVVYPEALGSADNSAFTKINLMESDIYVTGDFWIGISGNSMRTLALIEAPGEEGTTAYERSYSGIWNGSAWDWVQEPEFNYQFRAILSYPLTGIEFTAVPASTELQQNYPNPFNPSTEISYSLRSEGLVTLSVFNTKGELVSQLVNGMKSAGNYSARFNGEGLNSGIYFYRLSVNDKVVASKKMMMLK